jgi:1-acyl-sn-glycerol-3-phosphate acyltransferase
VNIRYAIARATGKVCFNLFGRFEVKGLEGVPPRGRLLLVANHLSYADPPVLVVSIPRRLWFVAKRGLFRHPIFAYFMRIFSHPMDRSGQDAETLRWMLRMLENEQTIGIFPEGTRSQGPMKKAGHGVAYVALKSQATILPVGIVGTEKAQNIWRIIFPFRRFKVIIGQPFSLPPIDGNIATPVLDSLTDLIMGRVAALLPKEYRGAYE